MPRREAIADMDAPRKDPPLARSIGAFFGHIVDAIVSDPSKAPERVEVRKETTEETRADGVTLRRTVIEEVVLPPGTEAPKAEPAADKPRN